MVILIVMNHIVLLKGRSTLKKLKLWCWEYVGDWQVQHPDSPRPNPRGCGEDCRRLLQQGLLKSRYLVLYYCNKVYQNQDILKAFGVQIFRVASTNKILRFGVNVDHPTRWPRPCSTGEGTWHQINFFGEWKCEKQVLGVRPQPPQLRGWNKVRLAVC